MSNPTGWKTALIWIITIFGLWIIYFFMTRENDIIDIPYSQFYSEIENNNIKLVTFKDKDVVGEFKNPISSGVKSFTKFKTYLPLEDPSLLNKLINKGIEVRSEPKSGWLMIVLNILPWILFIGFWFWIFRQSQSGASKAFQFGKSRARIHTEMKTKVSFQDVAGVEEAKEDLNEIILFLKEPQRFTRLGGKIPKGVILIGPPGTGKTLLARAVAGEADVPFLSLSGSDFVEMFVGVGAARVRDLFKQAKQLAPSIIFIDEIDAVGRQRGAGLGGGHDEREQTLNQLLVEMDGFDGNEGVILIAATNRPDILDRALLRPGRFDRRIVIDVPDVKGREEILKVHTKKVPLESDIDLSVIARSTPGFTGADIANLVNEAALLAARNGEDSVSMKDLEQAKDKVLMGAERKSLILSDSEKERIAYHEGGHALVSIMIPGQDPVHKISIIPRGLALGLTQTLPVDEKRLYPQSYLEGQLATILGGRAAEEIIFNEDISTGASNDLERATHIARKMVCEWGMSDKVGPLTIGKVDKEIFLGRELGMHREFSEDTAKLIDSEIKRFIEEAYTKAKNILLENIDKLETIAKTLLKREVISGKELSEIVSQKKENNG